MKKGEIFARLDKVLDDKKDYRFLVFDMRPTKISEPFLAWHEDGKYPTTADESIIERLGID